MLIFSQLTVFGHHYSDVKLTGKENSLHFMGAVLFECPVIFGAVWIATILNGSEGTGPGRLSDRP